jgi:hypothetical protein
MPQPREGGLSKAFMVAISTGMAFVWQVGHTWVVATAGSGQQHSVTGQVSIPDWGPESSSFGRPDLQLVFHDEPHPLRTANTVSASGVMRIPRVAPLPGFGARSLTPSTDSASFT